MKKMMGILISLCLIIGMLAACGNSENSTTAADTTAATTAAAGETSKTETAAAVVADTGNADADTGSQDAKDSENADADEEEDIAEIDIMYLAIGTQPGVGDVQDAINAITEEEINTHVNIHLVEPGSIEQQISLMMSSNEKLDLTMTFVQGAASFGNMYANHQLMDITDLLAEYGQGVLDTLGDLVNATTKEGRIYGVTGYRSLVASEYIVMRTDVLEDLGLLEKAQNMTTLTEYEEILEAVTTSEKWNYLYGLISSDGQGTILPLAGGYLGHDVFADDLAYDQLGDMTKIIAIEPDGSDPTVKSNFGSDEYHLMYEQMKDWYDKGYVYKDSVTSKEVAESVMQADVAFSYFSQSEIGIETSKESAIGRPVTCVKMLTLPVSTSSCTKFDWVVPVTATEPEAAVKFLNMMFTDERICNLLAWGIEGVNYVVEDGVARYPDGVDASSCTYHTMDFAFGNQFLILPWEGQSADFRQIAEAELKEGGVSAYLGFSCDTDAIQNEIAAITNVVNEYRPSIDSGMATEEDYQAFLEKLDNSGLQVIIAEYQSQLDAWMASR